MDKWHIGNLFCLKIKHTRTHYDITFIQIQQCMYVISTYINTFLCIYHRGEWQSNQEKLQN